MPRESITHVDPGRWFRSRIWARTSRLGLSNSMERISLLGREHANNAEKNPPEAPTSHNLVRSSANLKNAFNSRRLLASNAIDRKTEFAIA